MIVAVSVMMMKILLPGACRWRSLWWTQSPPSLCCSGRCRWSVAGGRLATARRPTGVAGDWSSPCLTASQKHNSVSVSSIIAAAVLTGHVRPFRQQFNVTSASVSRLGFVPRPALWLPSASAVSFGAMVSAMVLWSLKVAWKSTEFFLLIGWLIDSRMCRRYCLCGLHFFTNWWPRNSRKKLCASYFTKWLLRE